MENPLDHGFEENESLTTVAATYARDILELCTDVAAVIFPTAINPPRESVINSVSAKLFQLVADLEMKLLSWASSPAPLTWEILSKSGFLRDPDLIDFILARVIEDQLDACISPSRSRLPDRLLDHADGNIADSAQMLLAADSLHRWGAGHTYLALPPELLHRLCWRIVAAAEVVEGIERPSVYASAKSILSQYSEAFRSQDAARKIVHFAEKEMAASFLDPDVAGLHLHVAALSSKLDLDHDHALRLIGAESLGPYALMLAACKVSKIQAIENIYLFRSGNISSRDAGMFETEYASLAPELAMEQIRYWSADRAQYLVAGNSL